MKGSSFYQRREFWQIYLAGKYLVYDENWDYNNEEHLLCYLMLYIYVITKEGEDYWISDKVWVVLSNNIDISHRSELSSLFSSDNAVDNIRAPLLTQTVRPHHRFLGNIKS